MKRNYIVKFFVLIAVFSVAACSQKEQRNATANQHSAAAHKYTCPMHPQVVQDKPGSCPICGMNLVLKDNHSDHGTVDTSLTYLLKPVNEQVVATLPVIKANQGSHIYTIDVPGKITYDTRNQTSIASRVSGRIERLYIKYNYQPVKKGQLIMEIYSPDLAAAQRELLFINSTRDDENMLQGAKQRLRLLGMGEQQISRILKTGKISYSIPVYSNASGFILEQAATSAPTASSSASVSSSSPGGGMSGMSGSSSSVASSSGGSAAASSSTPVLLREGQYVSAGQSIFTVYQTNGLVAEFSLNPEVGSQIKKDAKVLIQRTADDKETFTGTIGLIQPMFNEGDNFTQARVYIKNKNLGVGELVVGHIPVVSDKGWWLPKEAVVSLGNKAVLFRKEGKVFVPYEIAIGASDNKRVQVMDDIKDWEIAKNAYYLVDSEGFIKVQKRS